MLSAEAIWGREVRSLFERSVGRLYACAEEKIYSDVENMKKGEVSVKAFARHTLRASAPNLERSIVR